MGATPAHGAKGLFDDLVGGVLQRQNPDELEKAAELVCFIHLGLAELTERAWGRIINSGAFIYTVLHDAMVALHKADRPQESFRLSQLWKTPAFARPLIDHLKDAAPRRRQLELAGFFAAHASLREGVRQLEEADDYHALADAFKWTHQSGVSVLAELDKLAIADPIKAYRLGHPVPPEELIDALPSRGGAVCLVDLFVSKRGILAHLLKRTAGVVEVVPMLSPHLSMDDAEQLARYYEACVIRKAGPDTPEEAIERVGKELHARLWCSIAKTLGRAGVSQIILVPDAWTRPLPHHHARVCGNEVELPADVPVVQREYLADLFPVEVAPAVQAVAITQWQMRPKAVRKVLMVADPGGDLPGARWSAEWMGPRLAAEVEYASLTGDDATKDEVLRRTHGADMIVFATHGEFAEDNLPDTAVRLHDAPLTLGDVLEGTGVERNAIYVLGACELGTSLPGETMDGTVLCGALLAGGAASVLAALWEMEDVSFGYLTERYLHYLSHPYRPAAALYRAMNDLKTWPRAAIAERVAGFLRDMEAAGDATRRPGDYLRLAELLAWVEDEAGEHPFDDVTRWGGAVVFGSGWTTLAGAYRSDTGGPSRTQETILGNQGEEIAEMIRTQRFEEAGRRLQGWLEWADGPERLEPLRLRAGLAEALGIDPRTVARAYRQLALAARAHRRDADADFAEYRIEALGRGGR
jgi:CHAT domain-containing protein